MNTPAQLFQPALLRILRWLSSHGTKFLLVELGDNNPHIAMPELPAGYTSKALQPRDLLSWAGASHGLSEEFLHAAQARGDQCVANFYHEDLVGYGFVTARGAPVTSHISVKISNKLLYRYKGWTHPDHRRKHLSHARGRLNSRLFPYQPGQRMVSYVEAQNLPSRLKHADVHPVRLGYCLIFNLAGYQFVHNAAAAKRFGFELITNGGTQP